MNRKNIVSIFVCMFFMSCALQAQQTSPQLLKEPADWSFERFALPPEFAPNFPYKGAEELRFSPGMFHNDSTSYFTYAFVAQLDDLASISQNDIQHYLLAYFKGLCSSTAKDRKLIIDTSKITVDINKKQSPANENIYNASLNVFGVFTDGAPVKLNMEVKVLKDEKMKKIYLVFIASPQAKTNKVWNELYIIQKDFKTPE